MKPIRDLIREVHRRSLWQVLGIYLLASWAVIGGVGTLGDALDLPDWFPRLALGLLIVGLPTVLATAFMQEGAPGREAHRSDTPAAEASRASGLFTWRRSFTGGVLAFALWGMVAAGWVLFGAGVREPEPIVASGPEGAELRLLVMPLENLTGDVELDVLGRLAADEIAREIDRRQPVAVVPSTTVANTVRSLGDDPPVEVVAEAVRATHVFAGTVSRIGSQLRLEVELIDPSTSERLRSVEPVAGPVELIDSLVAELASRAAAAAVVVFNPAAAPWVGDMSTPTSAAAYQAFVEQISAYCASDYETSVAAGRRAIQESPRFVAALHNLMLAHQNLRQIAERDSLRSVLDGLRGEMTRNEELSLDAVTAVRDGDLERAERAIDEAYRLDPVGRAGSAMQIKVWRWKLTEAVGLAEQMDLPGACPFQGYYRDGAIAYHGLGRFQEELAFVRGARAVYPEDLGYFGSEAGALAGLGREEALDSLLRTLDAFPVPARFSIRGRVMLEMRAHGLGDAADRLTETMLAALPERPTSLDQQLQRGQVLYWARRWEEIYSLEDSATEEEVQGLEAILA
jgi:TolB-like protein/tetratricopeptide (TPR) repeat protein